MITFSKYYFDATSKNFIFSIYFYFFVSIDVDSNLIIRQKF